ncbi:hypothetical protein B0H17DRAFT_1128432 [Mycena rosella]|uniref:Uncharacterized protein n=1 Tax=Mycena rosella TaxID=1033263 RepID=A0AAD7GQD9_MYCRO|nr:hypothetical protein B0H17DRAFT_1128432 [Mycena rosella]
MSDEPCVRITGKIADIQYRGVSAEGKISSETLPPFRPNFRIQSIWTIFIESHGRDAMDILEHLIQSYALNQIITQELSLNSINSGRYFLANSWTTDLLFCPVWDFPTPLNPCVKYIAVQHSYSNISRIKIGDFVEVEALLYRRDSYEDARSIRVYAILAKAIIVNNRA